LAVVDTVMTPVKQLILLGILLLTGCAQPQPPEARATAVAGTPLPLPSATVFVLPTLYPTATPLPTATPAPTRTPAPTAVPQTPIAFDQVVVDIHYRIVALGLDRRLQGNVSGELTLLDESTGQTVALLDQGAVLLEMQQNLPLLNLEPIPDGCESCVYLSYDLPLAGESATGWLRDTRWLASLDNFTAIHLGAHFPPDTVAGLRRNASGRAVAHTAALTEDGRIWLWLGTEGEVAEPLNLADAAALTAAAEAVPLDILEDAYTATCAEAPRETLLLNREEEKQVVRLICPELSLPLSLQPLYQELDRLLQAKLGDRQMPPAQRPFPLEGLLLYRRADGASLLVKSDGLATAAVDGRAIYSETVTVRDMISLSESLLANGRFNPDMNRLDEIAADHLIILRHQDGVSFNAWSGPIPLALQTDVNVLNDLLDRLLQARLEVTPTATPASNASPTPPFAPTPTP
jgi:hypothetical protein